MRDRAKTPDEATLPWWPAPRRRATDREPLTRDEIVAAALRIVDAEGVDALSMRRLGNELGAGATSLYWHVRNKEQLLDLVSDAILGEVVLEDDPTVPWRERAATGARELRAALLRHRRAAALPAFRVVPGPNAIRATEHMLGVLRSAGFGGAELWNAYQSLLTCAMGYALLESRAVTGAPPDTTDVDDTAHVLALLEALPADRYPNLHATVLSRTVRDGVGEEGSFEWALQRLLDGIEAQLAREAGPIDGPPA